MQEDKDTYQEDKDTYSDYDLDDWQWEFIRRNSRYRLRYRAVQRAKERGWGFEVDDDFVFIAENWAADLRRQLSLCNPPRVDDPNGHEDFLLPNPDLPRDRFTRSPVRRSPAVVMNGPKSEIFLPPDVFESAIPQEHRVTVDIDARYKLQNILDELSRVLPGQLRTQKFHTKKYKSYLQVWDLRKQGFTQLQIAKKLWADEVGKAGAMRSREGGKGFLEVRAHDREKAADDLIENSFRPNKHFSKQKKN
jgi:hypothetical protein